MHAIPFKVVILGPQASGKTSLIQRLTSQVDMNGFNCNSAKTYGHFIRVSELCFSLQLHDTRGAHLRANDTVKFLKQADAAVLVFDAADRQSFVQLELTYNFVREHVRKSTPIVIVANKIDLVQNLRPTPQAEVKIWSENRKCLHFETSFAKILTFQTAIESVIKKSDIYRELHMPYSLKIVIIGETNVGKSSLTRRLVENSFFDGERTTIGFNYQPFDLDVDGLHFKLDIWDTAGQERFNALAANYYRNADGALLVYDVTDRDSYHSLQQWLVNLEKFNTRQDCVKILIGNKWDLVNSGAKKLQIQPLEARTWATSHDVLYFEHYTSAKNNVNVKHAFETMLRITSVYTNALEDRGRGLRTQRDYNSMIRLQQRKKTFEDRKLFSFCVIF